MRHRTVEWKKSLTWLPRKVRDEFKTRGSDARFLMWISFLFAFIWARAWVMFFAPHSPTFEIEGVYSIGSNVVIFGYHPHHIATGVFLMAIAGWLGLHYQGKQVHRVGSVFYGLGLGLIVDEIGFIVEPITYMEGDWPHVFGLVVIISGLMMSTIYFPYFWAAIEGSVAKGYANTARFVQVLLRRPAAREPEPRSPAEDDAPGTRPDQ